MPLVSQTQSLCSNEEQDRQATLVLTGRPRSLGVPEETQHFISDRIERYKEYLAQRNPDDIQIRPGLDTVSPAKHLPIRVSPHHPIYSPSSSRAVREVSRSPERPTLPRDWAEELRYDPWEWEA